MLNILVKFPALLKDTNPAVRSFFQTSSHQKEEKFDASIDDVRG